MRMRTTPGVAPQSLMTMLAAGSGSPPNTRVSKASQTAPLPSTEVLTTMRVTPCACGCSSTSRSPEPTTPARARPAAGKPAAKVYSRFSMLCSICVVQAVEPVEEQGGSQQVCCAARRYAQLQHLRFQREQGGATLLAGSTASGQHLRRASLHVQQSRPAAARQHAGVVQLRNDGQQRIQARRGLRVAACPRSTQTWQAHIDHMRKGGHGLAACATYLILAASQLALVARFCWRATVRQACQCSGTCGKRSRCQLHATCAQLRGGRDQQAQCPDRAAMSIDA